MNREPSPGPCRLVDRDVKSLNMTIPAPARPDDSESTVIAGLAVLQTTPVPDIRLALVVTESGHILADSTMSPTDVEGILRKVAEEVRSKGSTHIHMHV